MNRVKNKISTTRAVSLYLFFGTFVGNMVYFFGYFLFAVITNGFNSNEIYSANYFLMASYILIGYPFALIIGGIPAIASGVIINGNKSTGAQFLRAGITGFIVSLLFYSLVYFICQHQEFNAQTFFESSTYSLLLGLALVGAIAAAVTRYRIHRIESKASSTNVSC